MKNDRDRMKCIISETIVALCNSGLDFSSELCVEGLLGITLDGRDILLVNINEVIKSGVSGAKAIPSRNIDNESESVFSEVTTSSDPKTVTAETNARINVTTSRSRELISSQRMTARRQTDPFEVKSLASVKSEPVGIIEDNKGEVHSVIDTRRLSEVSWNEHGIGDSVQPVGSDVDESYIFAEQDAEDQYCKMDTSDTSEQFYDLSEPSPDEASSLPIVQQLTHPVCLYSNTARNGGVPTSSAGETHHSQMSPLSSQICLQGPGDIAAAVADNIANSHRAATSAVANELAGAFPTSTGNQWAVKKKRGRPYTEFGFKITCLDKPYDNLNLIRHDELHKIGLGIPSSELVGGRRVPTKLPISWTVAQLRQKIRTLFPRLQCFTLMHGNQNRKLVPTVSTSLGDLKKEVLRGALYIIPDGPLKPFVTL